MVDTNILSILRERFEYCMMYEGPDNGEKCTPLWREYEEATANWFTKCNIIHEMALPGFIDFCLGHVHGISLKIVLD